MAAVVTVSFGCPGLSTAATLNVPADYPTIQACINATFSSVHECVVAPGTYHERINFLGKAITVRSSGGRDVTIIDTTELEGSAVMCASGEGPDTVLDGFTITGGIGIYIGGFAHGGGMYNLHSNPTVTNCAFTGNAAYYGGGMYNEASSPTVINCTFSSNMATYGGGMDNVYYSSPTVTDCIFSGNVADVGGGMYNDFTSPTVTHCTFSGNTASNADYGGGGGMSNVEGSPTMTNCTFNGNTAANYGGGMYNYHSGAKLINCTFSGNTATNFSPGGGMFNSYSSPKLANCMFSGNTATYGSGMFNSHSSPTVANCTFSGNTGRYGGGMFNSYSSPTVTNCILWGDIPREFDSMNLPSPTFRFSDLQSGLPPGAINGGGNIYVNPMFVRPPDPGPDGTWNGVDDDYGDLRLQAGSPCINAGDPDFVPQLQETDLDGHARVLCGLVDMGAYEFGIGDYNCDQTVNLLDFAAWQGCMTDPLGPAPRHSTIDIRQSTFTCAAFDFDADGDVDLLDFGGFQTIFKP